MGRGKGQWEGRESGRGTKKEGNKGGSIRKGRKGELGTNKGEKGLDTTWKGIGENKGRRGKKEERKSGNDIRENGEGRRY